MLQPSDPPQLASSSGHEGRTEGSRQLPQQAQYPYHQQQQYYGHHVAPQQSYAPGSLSDPTYGMQGTSVSHTMSGTQQQQQLVGVGGVGVTGSQRAPPVRPSPLKWVSMKEVVFVFLVCSIAAALFRVRDSAVFQLAWEERLDPLHYRNGKFPLTSEKLPTPIVTDMDNDGLADILMLTYDDKLKLVNTPVLKHPFKTKTTIPTVTRKFEVNLAELSEGTVRPVAMATGFLRPYQSMLQVRQQVVALLMSDWSVLCLDHQLKLLWKAPPLKTTSEEHSIVEGTVLVSPVSIHKGDLGSIIVGGREFNRLKPEESMKRMRRGKQSEDDDDKLLDTLGHYTVYALEGRHGEVRWHHTPKDFHFNPAFSPEVSTFHHLKLILQKQFISHDGEVSWHQYSSAFRHIMPHTWQRSSDTHFELAHFKKDKKKKGEKPGVTNHISKVGDMAVDHIAGLAFGGQQPHSPSEHVVDPNVLVIHTVKGVDVLHLYQGRPLCSLRLSPYHSTHADINGDGTIDHIHAVVNPGEASLSEDQGAGGAAADCYGKAMPMAMTARPLFKHSICKASHWTETFINTDKWVPALNKAGRKRVDHSITEPLAPIVIESAYHSLPLKLHLGGGGWDVMGIYEGTFNTPTPSLPSLSILSTHHQGPMYDSIFVLSSGRVTSIGPQGEFNWQVDTAADWDEASGLIYNPEHRSWKEKPQDVMFAHGGFVPSAEAFSAKAYGKKDHILVSGWNVLALLSGEDGTVTASLWSNCQPVAPLVIADFTGDGLNDLIVTCADKYIGLSLSYQSGFWQSTVLSIFVSMVIVVVAIYARQKSVALFPAMKAAQD